MSTISEEIKKRRTFAIISHPDAGKTTLTEKFLLYGGAINLAGTVKGRKAAKHAVSDWMEIEKERGISVTSSVMQFEYDNYCINILDTPGHQDFSEDTYRTLMAADSAVMVIDGSKGVEAQTIKLFKVCVMRGIPIFTFINKMDREARDPFELMDDIENVLGIRTCPVNWPIGCGKNFKGVYDRDKKQMTDLCMTEPFEKRPVELPDLTSDRVFPSMYQIKARIQPEYKWRLVEEFGPESFTLQSDGTLLFSAAFVDKTSIVGWIVSFGGGAELLEPSEFRQDILAFAESIREKYMAR